MFCVALLGEESRLVESVTAHGKVCGLLMLMTLQTDVAVEFSALNIRLEGGLDEACLGFIQSSQ